MLKKIVLIFLVLFICIGTTTNLYAANFNISFEPKCEAMLLINLDTNTVVYEKNADKKMFPASLTKIMTYIITAENISDFENTKVTIKNDTIKKLAGTGSAVIGFHADDTPTIMQLLHCLMIKSGGDAASALADYVGGGDESKFIEMMNQKAKELGCDNTHFVNPHGLHDEDQYTTARDLAKITQYAMALPDFMDISSKSTSYIMGEDKFPLVTTNKMIDPCRGGQYYYSPARGIKTGSTDEAGKCLISTATSGGYTYLCVALKSPNDAAENFAMLDSKSLYQWAFGNLVLKQVIKQDEHMGEVKVNLAFQKDSVFLVPEKSFSVILPKDISASSVDVQLETPESVDAPIKTGQKLGTAVLKYANKELARVDLISGEEVARNPMLYIVKCIGNIINSIWFKILITAILVLVIAYVLLIYKYNKGRKRKRHTKTKMRYK